MKKMIFTALFLLSMCNICYAQQLLCQDLSVSITQDLGEYLDTTIDLPLQESIELERLLDNMVKNKETDGFLTNVTVTFLEIYNFQPECFRARAMITYNNDIFTLASWVNLSRRARNGAWEVVTGRTQ